MILHISKYVLLIVLSAVFKVKLSRLSMANLCGNLKIPKLKIDYGQKMLSYAPVYIMYRTLLGNILSYIAHLTKNLTNLLIESLVGFKKFSGRNVDIYYKKNRFASPSSYFYFGTKQAMFFCKNPWYRHHWMK